MPVTRQQLEELRASTDPSVIKWMVKTINEKGATVIPYIDRTNIVNKIDEVVGSENWKLEPDYLPGIDAVRSIISINTEGNGWVAKGDFGSAGKGITVDLEAQRIKSMASDALKRAATLWGVGADLRSSATVFLGWVVLGSNGKYLPKNQKLQPIYDKHELTEFIWTLLEKNNKNIFAEKRIYLGQEEVRRAFEANTYESKPTPPIAAPALKAESAPPTTPSPTQDPEIVAKIVKSIDDAGSDVAVLAAIKDRMVQIGYYAGYPKTKIDAALS